MTDAEKLISVIETKRQGEDIIMALETISSSKAARGYLDFEVLDLIDSLGKSVNYSTLSTEFKKLFFKIQIVSLTLAFSPSKGLLSRLKTWFEENFDQRILLDIKVDPGVIGGIQIICNEHFRDYTIRRKLEEKGVL